VKRCQDLPGQELFQYVDNGHRRVVTSADVNAYLREATGAEFTAKDFRTWAGTLLAVIALRDEAVETSQRKAKSVIVRAVERVAKHLGNTPSVCRSCYIHPYVLECYADGTLRSKLAAQRRRTRGLSADESAVLALLESRRDWRTQLAESARAA
jgi:DNA topoisomerase-1